VVAAGLASTIGVTPMIGINDTNTEIVKLADANTLLNFASSNTYITRLSFWSVTRDNEAAPTRALLRLRAVASRRTHFNSRKRLKPSSSDSDQAAGTMPAALIFCFLRGTVLNALRKGDILLTPTRKDQRHQTHGVERQAFGKIKCEDPGDDER